MTERHRSLLVDLREIAPDPPDGLLNWQGVEARVARRRRTRSAAAIVGCVTAIAGIVLGVTAVQASRSLPTPAGPATMGPTNGPMIFAQQHAVPSTELDNSDLVLASASGSDLRALTHGPGAIDSASVTRDGREVAYVKEIDIPTGPGSFQAHDAIWVIGTNGTDNHLLYRCAEACDGLAWSPEGNELAFALNGTIMVVNPSGASHLICGAACGQGLAQPAWSPDGDQIAFSQQAIEDRIGPFGQPSAISVVDSNGQDLRKLTDRVCVPATHRRCTVDSSPQWSPSGAQIAFARRSLQVLEPSRGHAAGLDEHGVFVINADGTDLRQVWSSPGAYAQVAPQWSPDGHQIAFTGQSYDALAYVVDLQTNRTVVISATTNGRENNFAALAWSPNGTRIALIQANRHRAGSILTASPRGGALIATHLPKVYSYGPLVWAAEN